MVHGTKNIDLTKESIKTTRIRFSYNGAIQNELKSRTTISKIQTVEIMGNTRPAIWRKKKKIQQLAIFKRVYLTFLTTASKNILEKLVKIQKQLFKTFPLVKSNIQ